MLGRCFLPPKKKLASMPVVVSIYILQCVANSNFAWTPIKTCVDGVEGEQLLYKSGVRTHSLDPRVTWVPWIVLDGVSSAEFLLILKLMEKRVSGHAFRQGM